MTKIDKDPPSVGKEANRKQGKGPGPKAVEKEPAGKRGKKKAKDKEQENFV